MTTNAGAERMERQSVGFSDTGHEDDSIEVIKQMFAPEFRNRLDAIVQFHHLNFEVISKIVDKELKLLREQLQEKSIGLVVTAPAKSWLAEKGYDRKMGARPMARLVQERLKKPLADELLFGQLNAGGNIYIHVENDELKIKVTGDVPAEI